MTSIEDITNNRIVQFILDNFAPCEQLVCSTCGGLLPFLVRLDQSFPNKDALVKSLKNLNSSDISQIIRNDRNCMLQVLESLSDDMRKGIWGKWLQDIKNDRNFALAILQRTKYGKKLPESMVYELLQTAESLLIISPQHRNNLRELFEKGLALPIGLKVAIEKDMIEEEERLMVAYLAAKERKKYLDGLASIRFAERVSRISSVLNIKDQDWRETWSICTDWDIETLKAKDVQKLIDLCEVQSYRWIDALRKLYDKRHKLRLAAIEMNRHQYGKMSPLAQLSLLNRNLTVPIEHYPVELAQYVSMQWLETLTKQERDHFFELLSSTRLRIWKKVRERCGNDY